VLNVKALLLKEYEKLEMREMPEPPIGSDDVLAQVKAWGI